MVLLSFWRSVRRIWFVNGAIYETLSTKAVRAVWIPSFRRHPIFSSYFRENDFYPIHQFHRWSCIIQGKLDSGLWGPSRADYGGLCASPRTFGDRVQLDRQVHIEDRRGRVVTMRKWSLYHLRSQWSDRWISYKLTHKNSRHRKPTASGWNELPRTTPLKIAYAHGKYLHNFWEKRHSRFTYSVLQITGTLWT